MAIYHLNAKIISRSNGRSATGASAYRSATHIVDERTGLSHNYTAKSDVYKSMILAPKHAPDWVHNRSELWNKVELKEKRKDAQLSREIDVAIPKELSLKDSEKLITSFVQSEFVDKGMVADVNLHDMNGENPHAHIMLTTRHISEEGFGLKNFDWNRRELLQSWRKAWEVTANKFLQLAGFDERIDHRTLEAQGIDRIPQIHLGVKVSEMEERGQRTERGARALEIQYTNKQIEDLKQEKETINHERDIEIERGEKQRGVSTRNRAISAILSFARRRNSKGDDRAKRTTSSSKGRISTAARQEFEQVERGDQRDQSNHKQPERSHSKITEKNKQMESKILARHGSVFNSIYAGSYDRIMDLAGFKSNNKSRGNHLDQSGGTIEIDRTQRAINRQLSAMNGGEFIVGIENKSGKHQIRHWNTHEINKAIPWLKRENAKGSNIYIKPDTKKNAGVILIDNLTKDQIDRMKKEGFDPAITIEKSPNEYQAWLKLTHRNINLETKRIASNTIAQMFGGYSFENPNENFGFMAGFTNRHHKHSVNGNSPWVLCREYQGQVADNGEQFINAALDVHANREKERIIEEISSFEGGKSYRDSIKEYKRQFKALIDLYGKDLDVYKADTMIASNMAKNKYSKSQIIKAIETTSPQIPIQERRYGRQYQNRIVDKVFQQPEVQKHLELEKTKSYSISL